MKRTLFALLCLLLCSAMLAACGSQVLYSKGTNAAKAAHEELQPPEPEPPEPEPVQDEEGDFSAPDEIPELDAFSIYDAQLDVVLYLGQPKEQVDELLGEPQFEQDGEYYYEDYAIVYEGGTILSIYIDYIRDTDRFHLRDFTPNMTTEEAQMFFPIINTSGGVSYYVVFYTDEGYQAIIVGDYIYADSEYLVLLRATSYSNDSWRSILLSYATDDMFADE